MNVHVKLKNLSLLKKDQNIHTEKKPTEYKARWINKKYVHTTELECYKEWSQVSYKGWIFIFRNECP